jgi:hypothetical protein
MTSKPHTITVHLVVDLEQVFHIEFVDMLP